MPYIRALIVYRALRQLQPVRDIASTFGISTHTVYKWLARYRESEVAGLESASSRPRSSPAQIPEPWIELIRKMRLTLKWTAKQIAQALNLAYSTVTAVLRRLKLNRASHLEPVQPVQRYEHPKPGDMLHMDIKKLPRFDKPGHRVTNNRRQNTRGAGYECVHICIDGHSRWAFARVLPDEQQGTTARFLENALAAYRDIGVEVKRLMADNGPAYRSRRFNAVLQREGIKHVYTRPYTPRTNGKAERFIQTMIREWAYAVPYANDISRAWALTDWINCSNPDSI
ncbi:IS481 family transposase [Marinobacterium stanieri]|uniref:Transposase n=1 Tax=Marinobacterium stanieri TaxID=49186 RepID=A0A1N6XIA2_9GAMM|nr:IS481 family transposase [Marinobacterium stanieri]SIR02054.1 Transposase [Marinobacterium stanieri]